MIELTDSEQKIVEKGWLYHLGNRRPNAVDYDFYEAGFTAGLDHAAAQLAALTAERDSLRAALAEIAAVKPGGLLARWLVDRAQRALDQLKPKPTITGEPK